MGKKFIINFIIAPEVMCRQNHTYAVDYYALGVIAYEFMLGRVLMKYYIIRDLMLVVQDKRLEIKYQLNKFK